MCFSTSVSFGSGAILGVVGILALKKVQSPSQLTFAAIPILFSLQQFTEGFVWLSLTDKAYEEWGTSSINMFLVFAQVLWPIWVPLSVWLVEKEVKKKKTLLGLLGMGILLGSYLAYCLFANNATAEIISYHISYTIFFPIDRTWTSVFYVAVTVLPLFISSHNKFYILGIAIVGSLLFSIVFYTNYLISVWCFFSAINSGIVLYLVSEMNKPFGSTFNLGSSLNPTEGLA